MRKVDLGLRLFLTYLECLTEKVFVKERVHSRFIMQTLGRDGWHWQTDFKALIYSLQLNTNLNSPVRAFAKAISICLSLHLGVYYVIVCAEAVLQ